MLIDLLTVNKIDNSNYRFYIVNNYAYLMGAFAHTVFLLLFFFLDTTVLMVYNIISILVFLSAFLLNRKNQLTLSTIIASGEIILHAILATYFIGWETGFSYYLLVLLPLILYNPNTTDVLKIIFVLLVTTCYIALKHYSDSHTPIETLSTEIQQTLYLLNSFFIILILSALTYYYSLASKISESRINKARQQADVANKTKSAFLANMSHELRTPLNAIIGYSELLKDSEEESGHEKNVTDLNKISDAGNHLLSLIDNILDLSKIESGKTTFEYQEINIAPLIADVISMINPLTDKNHNTLTLKMDPDIGSLFIDPTKLKQILFNILSNANKFTTEGTIHLNVYRIKEELKEWIYFCITDTGIGVAEDKLAQLFEPFSQAEISTARLYGGTGLGLTISKHFVTLMNGTIDVKSEVNKGSAFTIKLPWINLKTR